MTVEFSRCDIGAPADGHFHSSPLVQSLFKGKWSRLSGRGRGVKNVFSEKGINFSKFSKRVSNANTETTYSRQDFSFWLFWLFSSRGKTLSDTPTVGLLLSPPPLSLYSYFLSFSLLKVFLLLLKEKLAAAWDRFNPEFSIPLHLSPWLYISLFVLSLLIHPSMPVFQSALTAPTSPGVPPHRLQSSLQQCHTRTRSHKGRRRTRETTVCVPGDAVSVQRVSLKEEISSEGLFSKLQETQTPVCVSGLASKNGIITTVLTLFLYDNLSSMMFVF